MNLCNFITLLQSNFNINQSTKTTPPSNDDRTYKTRYKRTPRYQRSINRPPISNAPQFLYISGGEIFLAYNTRIWGGFKLAIMRVCSCGKIFALNNSHIKHGEIHKKKMKKNCLESIKNFRQKCICVGDF